MQAKPIDLSSVTRVGLDIAKDVFCVHAVDAKGHTVLTRLLRRHELMQFFAALPSCLVGMEACGSSHYWGRELRALGHDVRLIHPPFVTPYVQRQKNDPADAAAICEAVSRPTMAFVPIRSFDSQVALMHHKVRNKLVTQRTQLFNSLRGHLGEVGIIVDGHVRDLVKKMVQASEDIPAEVRIALEPLVQQIASLSASIRAADLAIARAAQDDPVARRLMSIPGVGPLTASALVAFVNDPASFKGPRSLSAFLGLVPRERSSGGKRHLGHITKRGNRYLRRLLVICAFSVLRTRSLYDDQLRRWTTRLREKKPHTLVAVAVANKLARIALAMMVSGQSYRSAPA